MSESLRRIKAVEPGPGYRLLLTWIGSPEATTVDLSDMIAKGGVFAPLADKAQFSAVRIGENARIVEWPEPKDKNGYPVVEIDADALYDRADRQRTEMLAETMRALFEGPRVRLRMPPKLRPRIYTRDLPPPE